MGDGSLSDIKYNQYSKREMAEGRAPIDRDKWNKIHGAGANEAPQKEGPGEKAWDYDTVKRHQAYSKEREKAGKTAIDLDTWAKINKGTYQK